MLTWVALFLARMVFDFGGGKFVLWVSLVVSGAQASQSSDVAGQLMEEYRTHTDLLHEHQPGERGQCLTVLVEKLRLGWEYLSDEQRAEITRNLAPSKSDLFESMPSIPTPPTAGTDTCWGQIKDNRYDSEHFSVQWNDGTISE